MVALALGALKESTGIRVAAACRDCGHDTLAARPGDDEMWFVCPECGSGADRSA